MDSSFHAGAWERGNNPNKIYSIEGILVYQEPSEGLKPSEGYKIDVSNFTAGVYYVKVGDRVLKFIKI